MKLGLHCNSGKEETKNIIWRFGKVFLVFIE